MNFRASMMNMVSASANSCGVSALAAAEGQQHADGDTMFIIDARKFMTASS